MAFSRLSDAALRTVAVWRPMLVLNRGVSGVANVIGDDARGMRRVTEHRGELAHYAITYLAGPEASWANGMRWRALQEAAMDLDLKVRGVGPNPHRRGGMEAVQSLGQGRTPAVAAYNDLMAIGAMRGFGRERVAVPDQVSVVEFDNIFGSDFGTPALTTVASPPLAMGKEAVELLLEQLRGGAPRDVDPLVLPVRLVVRDSTGACQRKEAQPVEDLDYWRYDQFIGPRAIDGNRLPRR